MDSQTSGNKNIIEIVTDKVVFTLKSKDIFNEYKNDYLILGTKSETILKTIETREQKKTRKVYKVIDYSSNQFLNEINEKMKQTITLIPSDEKFTKRLAKEMKKNPEIKRVPFFTGKLN